MHKDNHALWKALNSFVHPLSILAILLLLINDHWLRYAYPSWLTGKLGDFTWLLFAPFILAILLSFIVPHTIKQRSTLIGELSIIAIGVWFATAKTIPTMHGLTKDVLALIVGYRGTLRMDITDLLTLPALLISWHIWRTASTSSVNLKPLAYIAFGLAILGTLASDDEGYYYTAIETICERPDGTLITQYQTGYANYQTYISDDAGATWDYTFQLYTDVPLSETDAYETFRCSDRYDTTAIHPIDDSIQYRWVRDAYVEKSADGGATWQLLHDLPHLDQDVREYGSQYPYDDYGSLEADYRPSPVSGIVHSETGTLILAMSTEGVMRFRDGSVYYTRVGMFYIDDLQATQFLQEALGVQYFLLPTLWFLIMVTVVSLVHAQLLLTRLWLCLGWLNWVFLVINAHLVFSLWEDIHMLWGIVALGSLVFIAIPMVIWVAYHLLSSYQPVAGRFVKIISITALLASLAYAFPLLLWTQGTVPRYYMTAIFSLLLVACVLASCYAHFRSQLPERYVIEKRKAKPKHE
ncbi:MAG: hypothetical protein AAF126_11105 [Chloroflexota bacterium]